MIQPKQLIHKSECMPRLSLVCGVKIIVHDVWYTHIVDRSLSMRAYHGQGLIKYSYGPQPNRNNRKCTEHSRDFIHLKWWLLCTLRNQNSPHFSEAMKRSEWIYRSPDFSMERTMNLGTVQSEDMRQDISWVKTQDQAREEEYSKWNDNSRDSRDRMRKDHPSQRRDYATEKSSRVAMMIYWTHCISSKILTIMTYILWRLKSQRSEHISSWK